MKFFPAILSGILFLLSFPPFHFGFLAPVSLAILLWDALRAPTGGQAFLRGFIAGVVFNTGILYWIPRLMQQGLILVLLSGMILMIAYLALWPGLVGLLVRALSWRSRWLAIAIFPLLWVGQEKLRELGQMSFPWIMAGYSYGDYKTLIQFLSIGGVYFYSLLVATTAVAVFLGLTWRNHPRRVLAIAMAVASVYVVLSTYGRRRIDHPPDSEPLRIAIVQPNVDQNVKWDHRFTDSVYTLLRKLSFESAPKKPDLFVWPESAMPCYLLKRPDFVLGIRSMAESLRVPIILGSLDFRLDVVAGRMAPRYFNSVFFYAPGMDRFEKYDKIRLVPFSEKLPFENVFPLISRVDLGQADFTAGDSLRFFPVRGRRIFTPICYEVVYPEQIRQFVKAGGDLMVHVTNDGWFGRSGMPYQHINIARFRAVECGIPAVQCANTGVSGFVDPYGGIRAATSIYTCAVAVEVVALPKLNTYYARHGDWVGWFSLWVFLLASLAALFEKIIFKIQLRKLSDGAQG